MPMGAKTASSDLQSRATRLAPDQLAVLAHELRTPLATMHATVELLTDFPTLTCDDAARLLNRLNRGLAWLETLVENLATWAADTNGYVPLQRAPVSLRDCIDLAVALVQPFLDRKHQRLDLCAPLPGPRVCADLNRLAQVLVNLLSNASTYSPWEEVIDLAVSASPDWVHIRVTDRGPGVPVEEQQHIFTRFGRGSTVAERRSGGLGLGLYIVKTLVELHGGQVGVDSTPGHGASFWFSLPALRLAPAVALRGPARARPRLARSLSNGRTHESSARR